MSAGAGVLLVVLATVGLSRLQPAAPRVEKSTIWMDTVKRGEMLRQVRGNGTLVPEDIRWIPTLNAGRVEQILVLPGAAVQSNTVLVELSNPAVAQAAFDAEWELKGAEAELTNLTVQLSAHQLTQQASVASAQANYASAKLEFEITEDLAASGLAAAVTLKQAHSKVDELSKQLEIEQERFKLKPDSAHAHLAPRGAAENPIDRTLGPDAARRVWH